MIKNHTPNAYIKSLIILIALILPITIKAHDGEVQMSLNKYKSTIRFIENKGQITDQHHKQRLDIKYVATVNQSGALIAFSTKGFSYQLHQWEEYEIEDTFGILTPDEKRKFKIHYNRVDIEFLNANRDVKIRGIKPYEFSEQYINEHGTFKDVISYHGIIYENLYPGIDLVFYEKHNQLKYDFIVHPGADAGIIQMKFNNYPIQLEDENTLLVKTTLGEIKEDSLIAYYTDNTKDLLNVTYQLKNGVLTFKIDNPANDKTLIIDPPVRIWGAYYGGLGGEDIKNVFRHYHNGLEYIFINGETNSSNLPVTTGAYQGTFGGNTDGYFMNIDKNGNIIYATYFGFNVWDTFDVLDCRGKLLALGGRTEGNGLGTPGTLQPNSSSGYVKTHIQVFDIETNNRLWGTYIDPPGASGGNADRVYNVKFDDYGSLYVAGLSNSHKNQAPMSIYFNTPGYVSYQNRSIDNNTNSHTKGNDGYLVRLRASNGVGIWGTYLGMFRSNQAIKGLALNENMVYCLLETNNGNSFTLNPASYDTLVTPGTYSSTYSGGSTDLAVVAFDSTGNRLWGTLFGGNGNDVTSAYQNKIIYINDIYNFFGQDFILLASNTNSSNLPTINPIESTLNGGTDWFLFALDINGSNLLSSTYFGGSNNDGFNDIRFDLDQNVLYVAGNTVSNDFNMTNLTHKNFYDGGTNDGVFAFFNVNNNFSLGLISSSYYGGTQSDVLNSIDFDTLGNIYIAGSTSSVVGNSLNPQPISTLNSYYSGPSDGFVARFCSGINPDLTVTTNLSPNPICQYQTLNFSGSYNISNGSFQNLYWTGPSPTNNFYSVNLNDSITNVDYPNAGVYHLVVYSSTDEVGCAGERVVVNYTPMPYITASLNPVCEYNDVTLSSNEFGHPSYQWAGPNGYSSNDEFPLLTNVTYPIHDGVYTVTVSTINNCSNTTQFYLYVVDSANMNLTLAPFPGDSICKGSFFDLHVTGVDVGTSYVWSNPTFPNQPDIYGLQASTNMSYTVTVTNPIACMGTATRSITVYAIDPAQANVVLNVFPPVICFGSGDSVSVWVTGGNSNSGYLWSEPSLYMLDSGKVYYNSSQLLSVTVTNPELCYGDITVSEFIQVVNNVNLAAFTNAPVCTGNNLSIQIITDGTPVTTLPDNTLFYGTSYIVPNAQPYHSGTYHIVSTNSNGCKDSTDITVVVSNNAPVIYNSGPVCEGGTLQLFSGFGNSYQWTGPNGFTSNQQNPVITNVTAANAGVYTVVVGGSGNCTGTGTTTVQIDNIYNGDPQIQIMAASNPICEGNGVLLYTNLADNYLWSTGATTQSIWVENPGVNTVTNQTYTVTITNISGCNLTATPLYQVANITVTFMPGVPAYIIGDSIVCENDTITITHQGLVLMPPYDNLIPTFYLPNGTMSNTSSYTISPVTNSSAGNYILQLTDPETGCFGLDTLNLQVIQFNASLNIDGNTCIGGSITMEINPVTYVQWLFPNGYSSTTNPLNLGPLTSDFSGAVTIHAIDTNHCEKTITQNLTISQINIEAASNSPVCKNDTLHLYGTPSNATFQWISSVNDIYGGSHVIIPNFNLNHAGTYTVVGMDSNGCIDTAFIQVLSFPSIDPYLQDDLDSLMQNSSVQVNILLNDSNVINSNVQIIQGPFHGSIINQNGNILYTPQSNYYGSDSLQYVICDPICVLNCDTAWVRIIVKQPGVNIPQLITPNNDGNNDNWVIDGIENYPNNSVKILNRWGDVFFEASPYQNNWSGQSNTGMVIAGGKATSGVYFYVIDLGNGDPVLKGYIVLEN